MTDLRIYRSRWKGIRSMLLYSVFIFGGFCIAKGSAGSMSAAYLSILLLALTYPFALYHIFDRRPKIIINEIGIFDRTANKNIINWEIIKDAYLTDVYKRKFICLVIDKKFEPSNFKGKYSQNVAVLLKAIGFQELNISLGKLSVNGERFTEFIVAMKNADKPKRLSLMKEALPASLFNNADPWELRDEEKKEVKEETIIIQ